MEKLRKVVEMERLVGYARKNKETRYDKAIVKRRKSA